MAGILNRTERTAHFGKTYLIERKGVQHVRIAFQPIWDIARNEVYGYEALYRPIDGSNPEDMIDKARQEGTIVELDYALLKIAVIQAHKLLPEDKLLFLNVEAETLSQKDLWDPWPFPINPGKVVLELTERALAINCLDLLYKRLAIYDFGTGQSNLVLIEQLKPEFIKIDRVFLNNDETGVLAGMVKFAKFIGTKLIAEGVESEKDLEFLRRINVRYAQGHFLGKPTFPEDIVVGYSLEWKGERFTAPVKCGGNRFVLPKPIRKKFLRPAGGIAKARDDQDSQTTEEGPFYTNEDTGGLRFQCDYLPRALHTRTAHRPCLSTKRTW